MVEWQFKAPVIYWRGPAPFFYARIPPDIATEIGKIKRAASYGWGVIPVRVQIGDTVWETSLFPKDGGYLVPIKDAVRKAEGLAEGDTATVNLAIRS